MVFLLAYLTVSFILYIIFFKHVYSLKNVIWNSIDRFSAALLWPIYIFYSFSAYRLKGINNVQKN